MGGSKLNLQMETNFCRYISGVLDLKSSWGCFNKILCMQFPVVLEDLLGRKQQISQYMHRSSEALKNLRSTVWRFVIQPSSAVSSCILWMTCPFPVASYKLASHGGNLGVHSSSGTKCASGCAHPCLLLPKHFWPVLLCLFFLPNSFFRPFPCLFQPLLRGGSAGSV